MKRIIFLLILVLLTNSAFSQHIVPTIYGIKFGLNRSNLSGEDFRGDKSGYVSTEIYAALFAEMKLSEKYRLDYEVLYTFMLDYHFLEVPFHLKTNLFEKTSLFAGPKLDFNLITWEGENLMSLSFDTGIQYALTNRFLAEARYSYCIGKIILEDIIGKRNTLRLGIGYRF